MMHHPALDYIDHRPWPLPDRRWLWRLSWLDLLFIHQPISVSAMQKLVPQQLQVDTFEGTAWISTVPFRMAEMMPKNVPCISMFRSFPELNVRTYVTDGKKPGVFFFSLDTTSLPLVLGARTLYGLPYYKSSMACEKRGEWFEYTSNRRLRTACFEARYRPIGDAIDAPPGSFEHWSAERYCLYSRHLGRLLRLEVHHAPWVQRMAEVELLCSSMLDVINARPESSEMRCYFSQGVDVVSYGAQWL
jgi:uncharacterized protein YqjF (DUF2071 family)